MLIKIPPCTGVFFLRINVAAFKQSQSCLQMGKEIGYAHLWAYNKRYIVKNV
jgi:hypothetical protein